MKFVPLNAVRRWKQVHNIKIPCSISTICPFCDDLGVFTLGSETKNNQGRLWNFTSHCPSCDKIIDFITIEPKPAPQDPLEIFIHPSPTGWHQEVELTTNVPEPLKRAFTSTVEAYNSKNYVATAVCCRRTLEGIFKYRVDEDKRKLSLNQLINEVKSNEDLSEALNLLSHAIREGGNLGAHFDDTVEPTHKMARHMVELLEYLLSYLYVLPEKISGLDDILNNKEL